MSGVMLGPSVPAKRTACTGKSGWSAEATVATGKEVVEGEARAQGGPCTS